ncbi:MAG TPA: hypothetical protein VGN57_07390 [Pirellulaceae bacterium]|nr:hypothetical protein [Pirellulaceae bacterium]
MNGNDERPATVDREDQPTADPVIEGHERDRRRAPLRRGCGWALVLTTIFAILFAVPVGVYLVYGIMDRQAYERELALLREAGGPQTLEEIEAFYPSDPAALRTTHRWLAAMQAIDGDYRASVKNVPLAGAKRLEQAEFDDRGLLAGGDLVSARDLVERYRSTIEAVHVARRSGSVARYPVGFEKLYDWDTGYLRQLRELTALLAIDAEVRLAEGDVDAAVEDVLSMVAAGQSLQNEPSFLSQMFRIACLSLASDAATRLVSRSELTDGRLGEMQRAFEQVDMEEGFRRSLPVERFMALHSVRGDSPVDEPDVAKNASLRSRDAEAAKVLEFYRLAEESTRENLLGIRDAQDAIDAETERLEASPIERLRYPLLLGEGLAASDGVIDFESTALGVLNSQARANLTAAALACERYRLANGGWPATLDDLTPDYLEAVPLDPFAERSLSYAVEEKGILLYSVGIDRVDDGGFEDTTSFGEGDVVVRLPNDRDGKPGQ